MFSDIVLKASATLPSDTKIFHRPFASYRPAALELHRESVSGEVLSHILERPIRIEVVHIKLRPPPVTRCDRITVPDTQALVRMGVADLFSDRADLTNFKSDGGLQATDIIHKAVVEVDEEGAKAAAVTVIVIEDTSVVIPPPPVRFTCDRPFLFLIRDNEIDNILFIGAYREP
ncbi:leukocyte elastase inhibitor-like [Penaeus monodon]|uniref:leukocyte elastase inhibitor-like n=1 Tax=Penaeus monodon TaxID=6687 RepID=UPI0018A75E2C|nr:leukocyte elastase inhibitor-like [Penaeus monodon]